MARITIIPSDTYCSIDSVGYKDVDMSSINSNIHAVQWFGDNGWVEFNETPQGKLENKPITDIEQFKFVLDSWNEINYSKLHPVPEPIVPPTAEQNKQTASQLLYDTDWTQVPSTSDPLYSTPYLMNADAFAAYRNLIRNIAINPVEGVIDWPVKPKAIWS